MAEIYDIQSYQPLQSLAYLLGKVRAELLAVFDRELSADTHIGPFGVTAAQFTVMTLLAAADRRMPISELCKQLSYDAGAMTRMLDRLESKGLIRRTRCVTDRRLVYLELTDTGRTGYPKMREISMSVQNRLLRGFNRAEVRQFELLLGRMLENAT